MAAELYQPSVEPEYLIQVGDRLAIRSYYDDQLNQEVTVRRDGRISMLLLGDIEAVGQTPNSLSKILSTRYSEHIRTSQVTVSVLQAQAVTFYVGGEVRAPSEQVLNGPITVAQAITRVGGALPTANTRQVIVLRRREDGGVMAYQLNVDEVIVNKASDIYLHKYDIVYVPMTRIAQIGQYVHQYINLIIPQALRFNANYTWIDDVNNSDNSRVEVVSSP